MFFTNTKCCYAGARNKGKDAVTQCTISTAITYCNLSRVTDSFDMKGIVWVGRMKTSYQKCFILQHSMMYRFLRAYLTINPCNVTIRQIDITNTFFYPHDTCYGS